MPSPEMPASAGGSEGVDEGSGIVAGSAGLLVEDESEPESPRRRCSHLLIMRAMLLGEASRG